MNTGKQINAMVIVLFISLIALGAYAIWDPLRSESAEDDQLEIAAERAATTYALNCRLCHGDRGEGGVAGGRLPAALPLDVDRLRGIEGGVFSQAAFEDAVDLITNTIICGRVGTSMPTWGQSQGGILNEEQIRQLVILITGGEQDGDPYHEEGFWEFAQEHADEIDAEATGHATVQMPGGSLSATETELTVSNAALFSLGQYIRIDDERLRIRENELEVQRGVNGTEAVAHESGVPILRDGQTGTSRNLMEAVEPEDTAFVVSDTNGFAVGDTLRLGDEAVRVLNIVTGLPTTGQRLAEDIGRTPDDFLVSGAEAIEVGALIRMDGELMEVTAIREDGDSGSVLEDGVSTMADQISVSDPAFFAEDYVLRVGDELIEVAGPVETGQTLAEPVGRAETTLSVSGTGGIEVGMLIRMGRELLRVTQILEPDGLRVERGVGGTSPASHGRRAPIFEGNLLDVERGVDGTRPQAHEAGDHLFLTVLEVERAAADSDLEDHSKNAEIFLGHRLIVERGIRGTEAAEHANGVLVRDFPPPPEGPSITEEACGQRFAGGPTGPTPTPLPGAQGVAVSLTEWSVSPDPATIADGPVTLAVSNDGATIHNFRVVATDLAPGALPVVATEVDEAQVGVVASSGTIQIGQSETLNADLPPGNYVLICNVPTHYELGMFVGFEVTAP